MDRRLKNNADCLCRERVKYMFKKPNITYNEVIVLLAVMFDKKSSVKEKNVPKNVLSICLISLKISQSTVIIASGSI